MSPPWFRHGTLASGTCRAETSHDVRSRLGCLRCWGQTQTQAQRGGRVQRNVRLCCLPSEVSAKPMQNHGCLKVGEGSWEKVDMSGQGNGPLPRAALCSKKWIKTPYDLVNVMHPHLLEQHNITKVHFQLELFFDAVFHHQIQNHFMKQFFTHCHCAGVHGFRMEPDGGGHHCR